MACPKGGGRFERHREAGVRVWRAPGSGALWCEAGTLAQLCRTPEDLRATFPAQGTTPWVCPAGCNVHLEHRQYSKLDEALVIDRCPECGGIYLDPGELDAVLAVNERIRRLFGDGTFTGPPPRKPGRGLFGRRKRKKRR